MNSIAKRNKSIDIPYGEIAVASLITTALSGIVLAFLFDIAKPYEATAKIVLLNPSGNIIRNLHYWSSQSLLIFIILHSIQHIHRISRIQCIEGEASRETMKYGMWLRLVIGLPVVFFAMLSGFILKGDADSIQAFKICESIFEFIPLAGSFVFKLFFGTEKSLQVLYINHAGIFTIYIFLITFEHVKRIWTHHIVFSVTSLIVLSASLVFNAPLNDGLNSILKGPWYFAGLQEILMHSATPLWIILISFIIILLFMLLPLKKYQRIRNYIYAAAGIYFIISIFSLFFRGEDNKIRMPESIQSVLGIKFNSYIDVEIDTLFNQPVPLPGGRVEGCLYCHTGVTGLSKSHNIEILGCASCHKGNTLTLNKNSAHSEMKLIPGNLSDADKTCGTTDCHREITYRVNKSLMNTMSGIINVNKFVFGETGSLNEHYNVSDLKYTSSESHLRNLCSSCHLGKEKIEKGNITELSRGGGCLACHLNYESENHPDINIKIDNSKCFGCHSRSGRISTSYEGLFESEEKFLRSDSGKTFRQMLDGRIFENYEADIHHLNGMSCIDCHLSYELMGDGSSYSHKEDAVKVSCIDCHSPKPLIAKPFDSLDLESKKIIALRKFKFDSVVVTSNSLYPFTNIFIIENADPELITKQDNKRLPLKKPLPVCIEGNSHKRLSCGTCHTNRISQCISCHTEFDKSRTGYDLLDDKDMTGEWIEISGKIYNDLPGLGVFKDKIETFIPGMIISIKDNSERIFFKRLFAPIKAHNIVRRSRTCASCHSNPVALGYGRGKLSYLITSGKGNWVFVPEHKSRTEDGLPEDAWIGFLSRTTLSASTRITARPFNLEEQKKILTAGACLTCHNENSGTIKESLKDFNSVINKRSPECVIPEFK